MDRPRADDAADYEEGALGVAFDVADEITVGASVGIWRFDGRNREADDYDAEALEVSVTYRF